MRKATRNYILFVFLFFLGLFQAVSGFVMWLALPHGGEGYGRGGGGGSEAVFWSLTRNTWRDLHDWVAVALLVMIITHLVLHWRWIVHMTKSSFKEKQ